MLLRSVFLVLVVNMGFIRGVSSFERTLVRMRPEVLQVQTGSQIWDHKDQGFDLPRILTSKIQNQSGHRTGDLHHWKWQQHINHALVKSLFWLVISSIWAGAMVKPLFFIVNSLRLLVESLCLKLKSLSLMLSPSGQSPRLKRVAQWRDGTDRATSRISGGPSSGPAGTAPSNCNMGLSENSVPLHPMVNDHYLY